jgi:hypothetical protein
MRLIEKVEAADEETQVDFMAATDAAMTGRSKKEILEDFRRAREAAEEDPDGEGDPDADDEAGADSLADRLQRATVVRVNSIGVSRRGGRRARCLGLLPVSGWWRNAGLPYRLRLGRVAFG